MQALDIDPRKIWELATESRRRELPNGTLQIFCKDCSQWKSPQDFYLIGPGTTRSVTDGGRSRVGEPTRCNDCDNYGRKLRGIRKSLAVLSGAEAEIAIAAVRASRVAGPEEVYLLVYDCPAESVRGMTFVKVGSGDACTRKATAHTFSPHPVRQEIAVAIGPMARREETAIHVRLAAYHAADCGKDIFLIPTSMVAKLRQDIIALPSLLLVAA